MSSNWTKIFLYSQQNFRKVCKNLDFSWKQYFAELLFKVSAWLSNHAMCKIGLKVLDHETEIKYVEK